ncbi:MAG: hypothetical protein JSW08_02645 [archaeon]|nr:MAG: hypothetical protein JSW08_02645 [archaeon]
MVKRKRLKVWLLVLVIVIVVLIVLFAIGTFKKSDTGIWDYNGLKFHNETVGNSTFYVAGVDIYINGTPNSYGFYFRNYPSELEEIPFNVVSRIRNKAYIAFSPETLECEDTSLIAWNLGEFFGRMGSEATGAITTPIKDGKLSIVVNCSVVVPGATILVVEAGSEANRVYTHPENRECIVIETTDCEIIKGSERFILGMLLSLLR